MTSTEKPKRRTAIPRLLMKLLAGPLLIAGVLLIALVINVFLLAPYVILVIPASTGLYNCVRTRAGRKAVRTGPWLERADELAAVLTVAPMALSIIVGGGIVAVIRVAGWLAKAEWPQITMQTVWKWPVSDEQVQTGLLGLDKVIRWLLMEAPLELWLVVIVPLLWAAAYKLPLLIIKAFDEV